MKKFKTSLAIAIMCGSSLYASINGSNVCFYEDINYQGKETCYNLGQVNFIGDGVNDTFSSVKVSSGIKVDAYEHDHYTGVRKVYSDNTPYLGDDFNDKISSLVVSYNITPTISKDGQIIPNFDPKTEIVTAFDITMAGGSIGGDYKAKVDSLGNNKYSAYVETNPYAKVVDFYIDGNKIVPTGARYRIGNYSKDATDYIQMDLATTTSSNGYGIYKVSVTTKKKEIAPNSVCFYEDINYQGKESCYEWKGEDLFKAYIGNDLNDTFSSVRVAGGMRTVVFTDENFQGSKKEYFASTPSLNDYNDKISSLYVGPSEKANVIISPTTKDLLSLHAETDLGGSSIYDTIEGNNQKFIIDGQQIKSTTNGRCLDVAYGDIKDGANVSLYGCHGGNNQKWIFTDKGEIKSNLNQNFCLDSTSLGEDSRVVMNTCNEADNQKWNIKSSEWFNLNTKVQFPSELTSAKIKQYFNVYDKLTLSLYDGYWAGSFTLPTGVKELSEIYITRDSTYGVTVERNGTKESLDKKTYGFRYVKGTWVLIRVATYDFPLNENPQILTKEKLTELYKSYTGIKLALSNGHWTREITLPYPGEEGSDLNVSRTSIWGTSVNLGDGTKIDLDNGSFYIFECHNGKWSLVKKY